VWTLRESGVLELRRFGGDVLNNSKRPKVGTTREDFGVLGLKRICDRIKGNSPSKH
jgi:hypothetical protein